MPALLSLARMVEAGVEADVVGVPLETDDPEEGFDPEAEDPAPGVSLAPPKNRDGCSEPSEPGVGFGGTINRLRL
jgi:hypothetical protein